MMLTKTVISSGVANRLLCAPDQ